MLIAEDALVSTLIGCKGLLIKNGCKEFHQYFQS